MDFDPNSREAREAEAMWRFAGTLVTHVLWPLIKGAGYALVVFITVWGLSLLFWHRS